MLRAAANGTTSDPEPLHPTRRRLGVRMPKASPPWWRGFREASVRLVRPSDKRVSRIAKALGDGRAQRRDLPVVGHVADERVDDRDRPDALSVIVASNGRTDGDAALGQVGRGGQADAGTDGRPDGSRRDRTGRPLGRTLAGARLGRSAVGRISRRTVPRQRLSWPWKASSWKADQVASTRCCASPCKPSSWRGRLWSTRPGPCERRTRMRSGAIGGRAGRQRRRSSPTPRRRRSFRPSDRVESS